MEMATFTVTGNRHGEVLERWNTCVDCAYAGRALAPKRERANYNVTGFSTTDFCHGEAERGCTNEVGAFKGFLRCI